MVDDAYLNGYAKHLGPAKSVVYLSLCRHVDKEQYAFPSEELIAQEFNISVRTVVSAIALLKKWNLISIKREKDNKGKWLRNTYYLLDKSEWKKPDENESHKSPHATVASGHPHANNDKNPHAKVHMQPLHTKVTHLEGNTVNEGNTHNNNIYITNNQEEDYRKSDQYIKTGKTIQLVKKMLREKGVLKTP